MPIPNKCTTNILGYHTDQKQNGNHHINALVRKANIAFKSIQRFRSAPERVNLALYKTSIRPIFEYAPLPSVRSRKCHIQKLQKFQNKVLRFINGTKLLDCVPNAVLHEKFKIENVHSRLQNLSRKQVNVILDGNLEHIQTLENHIASQIHGQTLFNDITN